MAKKQAQKLTRPQKKAIKRVLKQYNEVAARKKLQTELNVVRGTAAGTSFSIASLFIFIDPTGFSLATVGFISLFGTFSGSMHLIDNKSLKNHTWSTLEGQKVKSHLYVALAMGIIEKDLKEAFTQIATSKATFQYKGPDKEKEIDLKMPNSNETPSEAIARLTKDLEILTPAIEVLDGSGAYKPPGPPDFKPKAKRLDV